MEEQEQVAIQYYQNMRHMVTCPNGHQYVFVVEANICLSWVAKEDVDYILNLKGGCCGQKKAGVYVRANESSIRRWTNKGGQ
jgi:hypothetical protein